MHISEIWIYPVKSLGGIRLGEARTEEKGLEYDRRWMIIDENDKFITQRAFPKMALLDVLIKEEGLQISNRSEADNEIFIPFTPISAKPVIVTVWNDTVEAVTVLDEADAWLSKQLEQNVRLVMMPASTERKADPTYAQNGEIVSFADGFPYLIISQASLDELNSRLEEPVTMKRFRPNFVISGTEPFGEDEWKEIKIGDLKFQIVKPCARCVLTTIDPETAEKGPEPLKTLAGFRKVSNKILFGQNAVVFDSGIVREGDAVTVIN